MTIIWVSLPWATFGMVTDGTFIRETAPIARKMLGRYARDAIRYYQGRGAEVAAFCIWEPAHDSSGNQGR